MPEDTPVKLSAADNDRNLGYFEDWCTIVFCIVWYRANEDSVLRNSVVPLAEWFITEFGDQLREPPFVTGRSNLLPYL